MAEVRLSPRVLIIEDDPASMGLLVFLLQAFGCETLTSFDGEAGIAIAQRECPDLIICDIQLPQASGYEVVRELKSRANLRTIPVVAVTAYAMVGDRERALSAGFDGYIPKPIEPGRFVEEVQAFLPVKLRQPATPPGASPGPQEETPQQFGKGVTVLAVDDRIEGLLFIRSVLEPHGYVIRTASGVREALASAREDPPDIVLSDVHMGDGSGHDLIVALETDEALASIPVILLSATRRDEVSAAGMTMPHAGSVANMAGPLEPQALLDAVRARTKDLVS